MTPPRAVLAVVAAFLSTHGCSAHSAKPSENDLTSVVPGNVVVRRSAAASVSLNASVATDGAYVAVSVTNTAHKKGDWVGLYLAGADTTTTSPLKWTYCDPYMPGYSTSGVGTAEFQVYNVRAPLVFHFFSGSTTNPVLIASSNPLPFADYGELLHPRVLPGATPGDYVITWTGNSSAVAAPLLLWGNSTGKYSYSSPATSEQITKSELCGAPATTTGWMDLGVTFSAQLKGLGASHGGSRVHYALSDYFHVTVDFSFEVPRLPSNDAAVYPFGFAAYGDLGRGSFDTAITWKEYGQGEGRRV